MTPLIRALWYIEHQHADELTLDAIAEVAGVSRFHMSRAFGAATGMTVSRYVRGRRLSQAAQSLAAGAPDILAVALDAGYGSHEAFTRAFRDQFGLTPEQVRSQRDTRNLDLVEPIKMDKTIFVELDLPRFENRDTFAVAGLAGRYDSDTMAAIPGLWQRFNQHIGHVPGERGQAAYGFMWSGEDAAGGFRYMAAVEVADPSRVPKDLEVARIPAHRYAVFRHKTHVSEIRTTMHAIWNKWLPESGREAAGEPDFFERYGLEFDPRTGLGGFEIWLPIKG